jgi:hypothetical protein
MQYTMHMSQGFDLTGAAALAVTAAATSARHSAVGRALQARRLAQQIKRVVFISYHPKADPKDCLSSYM